LLILFAQSKKNKRPLNGPFSGATRLSRHHIGVNAAGVAGVATPTQYFNKCFIFPFSGTSEYRKSQSFSSAPYHTILRWKIHKFSGKGFGPSPNPTTLAAYGASILAFSALNLPPLTPNVSVALTPIRHQKGKTR